MFSSEVERLAGLVQGAMGIEGRSLDKEAMTRIRRAIQLRIDAVDCVESDMSPDAIRSVVGVLNYNGIICD